MTKISTRTALLASLTASTLFAAPALAQQGMTPQTGSTTPQSSSQTAPTPTPTAPASSAQTPAAAPAAPGTLQLQPGSDVKGSDGTVLGKLEGVRNNAGAQELTVRGADGQLRGVPLGGLRQEGAGVVVGWSSAEYAAAPAIAGSTPAQAAPAATPSTPSDGSTTTDTTEPAANSQDAPVASPPTLPTDPTQPGEDPTPPATEPQA